MTHLTPTSLIVEPPVPNKQTFLSLTVVQPVANLGMVRINLALASHGSNSITFTTTRATIFHCTF